MCIGKNKLESIKSNKKSEIFRTKINNIHVNVNDINKMKKISQPLNQPT